MKIISENISKINWQGFITGFSLGIFSAYHHYSHRKQSNYSEIINRADKNIERSEHQIEKSKELLEKIERLHL